MKFNAQFGSCLLMILFMLIITLPGCENQRENKIQTRQADVALIDSFTQEFQVLIQLSPDSAREKVNDLQQKVKDSLAFYRLASFHSRCFYAEGKIDSAIDVSKEILRFCERQNQETESLKELKIKTFNDLGVFLLLEASLDSSLLYFQKSENAILQQHDQEKRIDVYINIADLYREKNNLALSANYYRKALMLADSLALHEKYALPVNMGLAHVYIDLNNFERADKYLQDVGTGFERLLPHEQIYYSNTRGNYYYQMKEYDQAVEWFYKTMDLAQNYKQELNVTIAEINLAELYVILNQNDSARLYLNKLSEKIQRGEGSPGHAFYVNGLLASLYLQTGNIAQAEKLLMREFDPGMVNALYVHHNNKRLEELYRQKGDFRKAYLLAKENEQFDKNNRQITVQNNVEELNFRYSQDTVLLKKDLVIHKYLQERKRLNNTLFIMILLLFVAVLGFILIQIYRKRKNEEYLAEQRSKITRLRMENIQHRVSPHFILNALNSLLPSLREQSELNKPVDYLVEAIRSNISNKADDFFVTIEDELNRVQNYIRLLESLNYELPDIEWDVDKVNPLDLIPSMSIQIPVENALKYAFPEKSKEDHLKITVRQEAKDIHLRVIDNGVGFKNLSSSKSPRNGTGNGLKILYKTIEILNIQNREKAEFNIEDLSKSTPEMHGTAVRMRIPLNYNYHL